MPVENESDGIKEKLDKTSQEKIKYYEKTRTFELSDKSLIDFQKIIELIFKKFEFSTKSAKIDDTLTIITFLDPSMDKSLQKENKIAIYLENDEVYVQVKGEISEEKAISFWNNLNKFLSDSSLISEETSEVWNEDEELRKLKFLSESNIIRIKKLTGELPKNKKKHVINRLKEIEEDINGLKEKGVILTEKERETLIFSLLKKKKSDRKKRLKQLVEEKKGLTAEEMINLIIKGIQNEGVIVNKLEVNEFLDNFQEQYNRLPKKEEIPSIVNGYIKMKAIEPKEEKAEVVSAPTVEIPEEPPVTSVRITPSEALIEIVKDYSFLTENEKNYFIESMLQHDLQIQKKMAENLEYLEKLIGQSYEIDNFEKMDLRKQLFMLDKEEISQRVEEVLAQKRAEEEALGWNTNRQLRKLGFLSEANITVMMSMIEKLPEERQKEVIDRLKEIENEFDDLSEEGIELTNWEREQYRTDLVKLTKKNRKERLMDLVRDKKEEFVTETLYSEIPQLRFEDNKKLIKELIWLNKKELDLRIQKLKDKIEKKLEKKQELFEKSSAGSTCPECGWPVGSFSKKCPRCGRKLIDWM